MREPERTLMSVGRSTPAVLGVLLGVVWFHDGHVEVADAFETSALFAMSYFAGLWIRLSRNPR